jgi:hypothetical protein|tara:strand:+ start:1135 stop:2430 length:1296 start_codon:yes stop_codon:yes gene_type:complete
MPYYKFQDADLFYNRVKTYPKVNFKIARGPGGSHSEIHYNNKTHISGAFANNINSSASLNWGGIDLYETNVDKMSGSNNWRYPFLIKGASMHAFSTVSSTGYHAHGYGDEITGSAQLTASIQRIYYRVNDHRKHVFALKSNLDRAATTSRHFAFTGSDSSIGTWNKATQEMNLIDVPSIFYGSSIQKGSINLRFYISGTLAAEASDVNHNGELVQIGPTGSTGSGSVAGVVLYDAGIFLLTGSWDIDTIGRDYRNGGEGDYVTSQWVYFGYGIPAQHMGTPNGGTDGDGGKQLVPTEINGEKFGVTGSSFEIAFNGINYIPTVTMLAHAPKNRLNHSNNPTYVAHSSSWDASGSVETITGSTIYREYDKQQVNNIAYSEYNSVTGSFKKTTFISMIKIYDEDMNCIGVAKVAKPVKKTPEREFTFKLKVDF